MALSERALNFLKLVFKVQQDLHCKGVKVMSNMLPFFEPKSLG